MNSYPLIQTNQNLATYNNNDSLALNIPNETHLRIIHEIYTRHIEFNINVHMTATATNFTSMLLFNTPGLDTFIEFLNEIPTSVGRAVFEIKQSGKHWNIPQFRNAIMQLSYSNYQSPHMLAFLGENSWIDDLRMADDEFNQEISQTLQRLFGMKIDDGKSLKIQVFSLSLYLWIKELEFQLPH